MKKPKWAKSLTKKDLKHIAETSETGKPSLRAFVANIEHQRKSGINCHDCTHIWLRLHDSGVKV